MSWQFNRYPHLEGQHAEFGPSKSSWLRYDDNKAIEVHINKKASEYGTRVHQWAKETIDLGIKQPESSKAIYAYINDAIGFRMSTEVVLYYSDKFFGTADAISFRNNILRIHLGKYKGKIYAGEIGLPMENSDLILPCGIYSRWESN